MHSASAELLDKKRGFSTFSDEALQAMDFMTPYLTALLGFLGLTDVQVLAVEGTTTDLEVFERSKQIVQQSIIELWSEA